MAMGRGWEKAGLAALVLVVLAGVVVVLNQDRPAPSPSGAAVLPIRVSGDFSLADGQPVAAKGGFTIFDNGRNATGMHVVGGRLVHGAPTAAYAASSLMADNGKAVTRIGADVSFGQSAGNVTLVVGEVSVGEKANGRSVPQRGFHLAAGPAGWHFGVWDKSDKSAGVEEILEAGAYSTSLVLDGKTKYRFEIYRRGDTVRIELPGGETPEPITDQRIGDWTGQWAAWELFETTISLTPANIAQVWAG